MGKYDRELASSEWDGTYHASEATLFGPDGRQSKESASLKRAERTRSNRRSSGHPAGANEDEMEEVEADEVEAEEDGAGGEVEETPQSGFSGPQLGQQSQDGAGGDVEETPQSGFSGPQLGQQSQDHADGALRLHAPGNFGQQDFQVEDYGSEANAAPILPSGNMDQSGEGRTSLRQDSADQGNMDCFTSAINDGPAGQYRYHLAIPSEPPVVPEASTLGHVRNWLEVAGHDREASVVGDENEDEDQEDTLWLPAGRPRYDKAIECGYIVAVKLAWQLALQDEPSVADQLTEIEWLHYGHDVLLSMQKDVLTAVASGNLAALYWGRDNDTVWSMFQVESPWMQQGQVLAPVVYILCLTKKDEGGRAHTPDELRLVINDLRRYGDMAELEHTLKVDNAYRPVSDMADIRAGKPLFFCKNGNNGRTRTRYKPEDIKRFCDALEQRLGRLSADEMGGPLRRPLQYVGRALMFVARKEQRKRGDRSNWLMQLVTHVCNVRWPGQFTLDAFPVCYQVCDEEAMCAEMLLALIADSWVTTGGGFNRAAPGLHGTGISHQDPEVLESWWVEKEEFRDSMGFSDANMPAQLAFAEEIRPLNLRGEQYKPSAASMSTQDQQMATITEGLARDRDELERLRRDFTDRIARANKEVEEILGAE